MKTAVEELLDDPAGLIPDHFLWSPGADNVIALNLLLQRDYVMSLI